MPRGRARLSHEAWALQGAFVRFAGWGGLAAAALVAVGAVFDGLGLLLLVPLLEIAIGSGGGRLSRLVLVPFQGLDQTGRLLALIGLFAVLMLVRAVVLAARDRSTNRLQSTFVEAVRARLVQRLAAAGWASAARISHARMIQALGFEVYQVGVASYAGLTAAVALVTLVGYCVLTLALSPLAGAVAVGFAALGGIVASPYLSRARALGRALTETHFALTGQAMAFLSGLKAAAAQGEQQGFASAYLATSAVGLEGRLSSLGLQSSLRIVTTTLAAFVGAIALITGLLVAHLPPAVLITLLFVLSRMSAPALAMHQGIQQMLHSLPAYGAITALEAELAEAEAVTPPAPILAAPIATGAEIELQAVGIRHAGQEGRPALENVSLAIPAGAFVGITGPSGSGKTTLLDLAAGLLAPQTGRVLAHGRPLAGEVLTAHRARLAYVAQDPYLFDGALRDNLLWSNQAVSEADMLRALCDVGAETLLAGLANGLDTRLGERGVLMSAGERQRLALARALLRRPALLILDEATNALDVESERAILERLAALQPDVTILMVAHRASSLSLCDYRLELPTPGVVRPVAGPTPELRRRSSRRP